MKRLALLFSVVACTRNVEIQAEKGPPAKENWSYLGTGQDIMIAEDTLRGVTCYQDTYYRYSISCVRTKP